MGSPVGDAWLQNAVLANRGAVGTLCLTVANHLLRRDIIVNAEILAPVVKYLGLRPSISLIVEVLTGFFFLARPKGKPEVSSQGPRCYQLKHANFNTHPPFTLTQAPPIPRRRDPRAGMDYPTSRDYVRQSGPQRPLPKGESHAKVVPGKWHSAPFRLLASHTVASIVPRK